MKPLMNLYIPFLYYPTQPQLPTDTDHVFCPKDPANLDFVFANSYILEDFFCKDITFGDCCHILFATDKMTELLCNTKYWLINATFKVVRHSYTQLLSIHALIKSGDSIKQITLLFIFMCGKRKSDYKN